MQLNKLQVVVWRHYYLLLQYIFKSPKSSNPTNVQFDRNNLIKTAAVEKLLKENIRYAIASKNICHYKANVCVSNFYK